MQGKVFALSDVWGCNYCKCVAKSTKGKKMKITNQWLKKHNACTDCYKWASGRKEREFKPFINALMDSDHFNWANWVIVRTLTRKQTIMYAIFAAEQVIDIFEQKCPDDKRPRQAIEAAKAVLKNNNKKTRAAAYDAAYAVYAASYVDAAAVAYSAVYAVYAAAYAAYSAVYADASYAEDTAAYAAYAASYVDAADAAYAAYAKRKELQIKIINYGLLLKEKKA